MRAEHIVKLGLVAALAVGCSKAKASEEEDDPPPLTTPQIAAAPTVAEPVASAAATKAEPSKKPTAELRLNSVGNTMTFDKTTLTVEEGQTVHLVFHSNSTMATLPHCWALVKPGTEAKVAAAGLAMGAEKGYIPAGNPDLLAYTPVAKPGESPEVTFVAPAAGTYPYICTVPGHYMMMKGKLIVTPPAG